MYEGWEIECKLDYDCMCAKFTQGQIYRIKDKFPSDKNSQAWYEIVGEIGMCQIPHDILSIYFKA